MALPWVDFVWSLKRYLSLYPLKFVTSLPSSTLSSGDQTLTNEQYYLVSTSATAVTWTLPSPSDNPSHVFKIKVQGAGNVTLSSAYIFAGAVVSTLVLEQGNMVTLTSDGSYWNVGD